MTQVPGPQGAPGTNGSNGTNGVDSFTFLAANFTVPAVNTTVTIQVVNSLWAAANQPIFIEVAGSYLVSSIPDSTHIVVVNLGYAGNASPTTVISGSRRVTPGGVKGVDGSAGGITLNQLSPTTTKGDIIVDNGSSSPLANDVRLGVGTNGKALVADSTQAAGLNYATITPNAATDKGIPRFNGASATPVPLQTSNLIITDDGAIQSTPSGGNARGTKAVDLQVQRTGGTQVASGNNSVISGGQNNTASGQNSVVSGGSTNSATASGSAVAGGSNNGAAGQFSFCGGGQNNGANATNAAVLGGSFNGVTQSNGAILGGTLNASSGTGAAVLGGTQNTASGNYSNASGNSSVAGRYAESAQAAGLFASTGDAQTSRLVMRGSTTNATPTSLFLDGISALITLAVKTTLAFRIMVSARRTDAASESAAFQLLGCIDQQSGGVATTRIVGSVGKTVIARDDVAWDVNASADTGNGALSVQVTGEVGKNINWVAMVELTQVIG